MPDKVYYPETIDTYPLSNIVTEESEASINYIGDVNMSQDDFGNSLSFPRTILAHELLSTILNTQTKKILGEFKFSELGAIRIGNYENGVSGDIRLSPSGILGRNTSGDTTFSIDGETGDATFGGTLSAAAGSLGAITIGSNAWHVDSNGNMWWGNFATYALAPIKISSAGAVDFTTGNFSGTLSAPSGTLGTITAGTITGATFKTKSTGVRVELTADDAEIALYDGGNDKVLSIDDDGTSVIIRSADSRYIIYDAPTSRAHIFRINNSNKVSVTTTFNLLGCNMDCNSYDINEVGNLNYASEVYEGDESPADVLRSVSKSTGKDIDGKPGWKKMDHSLVSTAIKTNWEKDVLDPESNEIHKEDRTGYSLNKLVMVQNKMLIEILSRVEVLESK